MAADRNEGLGSASVIDGPVRGGVTRLQFVATAHLRQVTHKPTLDGSGSSEAR